MLPKRRRSVRLSLALSATLFAAGCRGADPELPERLALNPNEPPGFSWLACPGGDPTATVRQVVGPDGGTLTHESGHILTVPAGAVDRNRNFILHEPASDHVAVIAVVTGNEAFSVPVSLTISYARCSDEVDPTTLQMFRENPNGDHDPLGGTPTGENSFRSDQLSRLSAYALATN